MSLEKALEANTEALLKLCDLLQKQGVNVEVPKVEKIKAPEIEPKAPEPATIELPGKTYAEASAEVTEADSTDADLIEETIEKIDEKPAITAEELLKKFRIFLGHDRAAAAALLAEFGVAKFNGPDNKPAIPGARWNEFAERCNVPG